ncbi:MAG TPA: hypothetical protein VGJ78_09175 [Vicinamibacterales bacterium]|jgi:hypothetical protein
MSLNTAYAAQVAPLIMQQGQITSMAQFARAKAISDMVQNIGAMPMQFMQMRDQRQAQQQQQQLRTVQTQNAKLEHDQRMREFNDEQTIRGIFDTTPAAPEGGTDWEAIGTQVSKVNPKRGEEYLQIGAEHKANAAKIMQANLETMGRVFRGATAQNWESRKQQVREGLGPAAAAGIPDTYDPEWVQEVNEHLLTANEWLTRNTPHPPSPTREPVTKLLDGTEADLIPGADGNWYLPGDVKTPIAPSRVKPLPRASDNRPPREPVTRLVDGQPQDIIFGDDGNWHPVGNLKAVIAPSRVRVVPKSEGGGVTRAQRVAADVRMQGALRVAEEDFKKQVKAALPGNTGDPELDDPIPQDLIDNLNERKLSILNRYRTQVGLEPFDALPPDWAQGAKPAQKPATAPQVAAVPYTFEDAGNGKVRVIASDGTRVVFPNRTAADAAVTEVSKQK